MRTTTTPKIQSYGNSCATRSEMLHIRSSGWKTRSKTVDPTTFIGDAWEYDG